MCVFAFPCVLAVGVRKFLNQFNGGVGSFGRTEWGEVLEDLNDMSE